jgi:predicted Zn-dependent peptidase
MSSRLFQEIREKRGLCYSVFSFAWSFEDTGVFGIYAGTAPEDLHELVPVMANEFQRVAEDMSEEETARARAQMKAGLLMSLESSSSRAEQIARQYMIYGRVPTPEEIVAKLDQVDAAALRRVAKRIMTSGAPAFAAVGPLSEGGGLESYDRLAARFAH